MVEAFTRGYAVVDGQKYGRFSLFGGNICGEFTELVENKRIEMKWRFKTWPDEHYSNVVIELKQKEDCTELQLTQTGIPASDYERTKEGWRNHYWQSIKQTFGFGALLF
jgi:activator of HSP90 ATPase